MCEISYPLEHHRAVSVLGALLILLFIPGSKQPAPTAEPSRPLKPQQENKTKHFTMLGDIQATDQLNRLDARGHLRKMLNNDALRSAGKSRRIRKRAKDAQAFSASTLV